MLQGTLKNLRCMKRPTLSLLYRHGFLKSGLFPGRGITDKNATLKLSISPQGIQTMVFRTEKDNEFIEPYSKDQLSIPCMSHGGRKGK